VYSQVAAADETGLSTPTFTVVEAEDGVTPTRLNAKR
jgi:hypothetical protein